MVVFALVAAPLGVTGCYDRQELEQQAFVAVLGVDKAPGNLIDCTFRIALPVNPSSGGSTGGQEPLASKAPVTIRAHSIIEAMVIAGGSIERTITFSHLSLILFGSDIAKSGVMEYVQPLTRYREFRRTVPFGVAQGTAKDVIEAFAPMLDTSIARVADGISLVTNRTGIAPECRLHDLIMAMENPHQDVVAPLYGINKYVNGNMPNDGTLSYQAGDVKRTGGNPVDWMGGAVFHADKVVDTINGEDEIYLRLLEGGMYHAKLNLKDPHQPADDIGVQLHKERAAQYHISMKTPLAVQIQVPIDVDVVNVASGIDYSPDAARHKLEQSLNKQLNERLNTLLHRLVVDDQADVIPISRYIRGKFSTYQEFAQYPWIERLKKADISVQCDVHVRRFGVQLEPLHKQT